MTHRALWHAAAFLWIALAAGPWAVPALGEDEDETLLKDLSPEEFLRHIRRPFNQEAWGEATGSLQCVSEKTGERRGTLRLRLTFAPESLHAQVVLNDSNVYGFEQKHDGKSAPTARVDLPEKEVPPGLFSFGIGPEDLTFAFIYWDLHKELPSQKYLGRACRVFELMHPEGKGSVQVWFSTSHGYPLKAEWYLPGARTPWRTLELKGAKKHEKDLWFIKEVRLEGQGWKTRVRFDHAEINPVEDRAAPPPER